MERNGTTLPFFTFLTLFKDIIPVYSENDTKHINIKHRDIDC
jgi:hypothetical protein